MRNIVVNSGMSLMDVALMYNGTMDTLLEIARENNLSLDYCFDVQQTILIPDDSNYYSKKIADRKESFATAINYDSLWILENGNWNDDNIWIDDDNWID
jgi:hypothetical protein